MSIKEMLIENIPEAVQKDEYISVDPKEVKRAGSRGWDSHNNQWITSFPATRLEYNDEVCRIAIPSDDFLEVLDDVGTIDEGKIILLPEFDKKKRRGSYFIDGFLPVKDDWKEDLKQRIEEKEESEE